jgi:hypothetical protein
MLAGAPRITLAAELPTDPKARRLAQEHETAGLMHKYLLKASY